MEIKYSRIVDALERRVPQRKIAAQEGISESLVCRINACELERRKGAQSDFAEAFSGHVAEVEREVIKAYRASVAGVIANMRQLHDERFTDVLEELSGAA